MEVASDLDRRLEFQQRRLLLDNFLRLTNDPLDGLLVQVDERVDLECLRLVELE